MKVSLQPFLPRRPGVGRSRKEPVGGVEKPGASLQPVAALRAPVLARGDRIRLRPAPSQLVAQARGAFRDQGGRRRPGIVPIQPPQGPGTEPAQPAVESGRMRRPVTQPLHRLAQAFRGSVWGHVRRAGCFNHRPRVALERRDLHRQYPKASPADLAPAQRYRRLTLIQSAVARPQRTARNPAGKVDQRADGPAMWTKNLRADRFAFDSRGLQGIIRDGDGNRDSKLSGSPRGTGVDAPVPHFLQKAKTLLPYPLSCKPLVHCRPRMSLSFLSLKKPILRS